MFSTALQSAQNYTVPVILAQRLANGQVKPSLGSAIVVNRDGWILTAGHIFESWQRFEEHRAEMEQFKLQRVAVDDDPSLTLKQKRKKISRLHKNPQWITDLAVMCVAGPKAGDVQLRDIRIDKSADIAIARLDPFDPSIIQTYPIFKDPDKPMPTGTSLCRLGFPFHQIQASFNETTSAFSLAPNVFPIPFFPNDGIHTRVVQKLFADRKVRFIETSSPGLLRFA